MPHIFGRKHGTGVHSHTYTKVEYKESKRVKNLREYEQEQIEEHSGYILEREFHSDSVVRACPNCFRTYMVKENEVYVCKKCNLKKIPVGVRK